MKIATQVGVLWAAVLVATMPMLVKGQIFVANYNDGGIYNDNASGAGSLFATNLPVQGPMGMAFDTAGNLYVANYANGVVEKYNSLGSGSGFITGLTSPVGLAFNTNGNLFVANSTEGFGNIEEFSSGGGSTPIMTFSNAAMNDPYGIVFHNGDLYVANAGSGVIEQFNSLGVGSLFTDMHSSADTNASPWGLAFDNNGNLWVADSATNQIDEYNSSGILVTQIANTNLNQPSGLAFDSTGNLYVANFNTNTIVKFVGGVGAVFATNGVPGVFGGDISAVATLVPEPSIQALLAIGAMLALVSSRLARCRHFRRAGS